MSDITIHKHRVCIRINASPLKPHTVQPQISPEPRLSPRKMDKCIMARDMQSILIKSRKKRREVGGQQYCEQKRYVDPGVYDMKKDSFNNRIVENHQARQRNNKSSFINRSIEIKKTLSTNLSQLGKKKYPYQHASIISKLVNLFQAEKITPSNKESPVQLNLSTNLSKRYSQAPYLSNTQNNFKKYKSVNQKRSLIQIPQSNTRRMREKRLQTDFGLSGWRVQEDTEDIQMKQKDQ